MKRLISVGLGTALMLLQATGTHAQSVAPDFTRCTTVNFLGGVAMASSSETAPILGGAIGWELLPKLTIETSMKWQVPDRGEEAFTAAFTAQLRLAPGRRIVPFVSGGLGVHSATYDSKQSEIPEFYRLRMTETGPMADTTPRFTDPAVVFGGGVSFFAGRHVSIRPEVETVWVHDASQHRFITTAAVRLAYHFERHLVTPILKPR